MEIDCVPSRLRSNAIHPQRTAQVRIDAEKTACSGLDEQIAGANGVR